MSYQLQSNTFSGLFVGQKIITLPSVDSTNDFMKEQLSNSTPFPEGTVIMAERQTAGRGQPGNKWYADPGANLTFSIYLEPRFLKPSEQFWLNIGICSGLCAALQKTVSESIIIKWPNDILFDRNKISGILIENVLQGDKLKHSVVGIGLNVNQTTFAEDLGRVTSIKQILHQTYSKEKLLYEICHSIGRAYDQLRTGSWKELKKFYLENLFAANQSQDFWLKGKKVSGTIRGVDTSGQLLVEFNGQVEGFGFKEVAFIL